MVLDDHAQVMALRQRNGMSQLSYGEWCHVHEANPYREMLGRDQDFGWVVEAEDGSLVGMLGNITLPYELDGRIIPTAAMTTWIVESGYRHHVLLLVRRFFEQPGIDLFLNTTANENADRALQAMRMPRFPVEDLDTCLYWITRPRAFTESAFRRQGWPLPYLASLPAGLALSAVDRSRRGWLRRGSTEIEVQEVDRFDEQFDAFWQERRFDSVLRLRRDSGTLNWLSEFARRRQEVWILTATSSDKLRGYGMFMERDAAEIGLRRMRIMDLQFRDNDLGAATAILAAALRRCRADGIHALETTGFQPVKRRLFTDLGARCRKLPNWRFYYKARHQDLANKLSSSAVWDPCSLDGDGCF
jgi:hypothetical protein